VEGLGYDETLSELKKLFTASDEDTMDDDDYDNFPPAIRDMLGCKNAIEALGSMMWCVAVIFWSKCRWTK
jgi:DNA mismatch repair protein MSH6